MVIVAILERILSIVKTFSFFYVEINLGTSGHKYDSHISIH